MVPQKIHTIIQAIEDILKKKKNIKNLKPFFH